MVGSGRKVKLRPGSRFNQDARAIAANFALGVDHLKIIAESFVLEGGVQCGFCIPGIVVRASHLIDQGKTGDRDAVAKALRAWVIPYSVPLVKNNLYTDAHRREFSAEQTARVVGSCLGFLECLLLCVVLLLASAAERPEKPN